MTICRHCGTAEATCESYPYCSGHCRAGYLAECQHEMETDWVRAALVRDAIRRSWPADERRSRCVTRRLPVEVPLAMHPRAMA